MTGCARGSFDPTAVVYVVSFSIFLLAMRLSFILLFLGLATLVSAQSDGWQYPFPYNPDGNSDGYISLNDMLELLSVYGQEYPETFYGDSTGAILDLGTLVQFDCYNQARLAGSQWRMMSRLDFARWYPYLADLGQAEYEAGTLPSNRLRGWLVNENKDMSPWQLEFGQSSQYQSFNFATEYNATAPPNLIVDSYSRTYVGSESNGNNSAIAGSRCFIVSEVLPEYEFSYCNTGSGGDFDACVTEKLNDGWIPMPGGTKNSASYYYQGFWRIAQD